MESVRHDANIERLIGLYQSIERASREMLNAAQDSDWERVGSGQQRCGQLIDQVRELAAGVSLNRLERKTKLRILRQIVRNEAQIRRLAYPWTERYEYLMVGQELERSMRERASFQGRFPGVRP